MIDPSFITAGGSLLGGILGKGRAPRASDTWRHTMMGIRGQAEGAREFGEEYGINPMALLGVSQPLQSTYSQDNSMMGQGIANAGLALAEGITAKSTQTAYVQKLEEQNSDLRKALDGQTLRPRIPGIYGARVPAAGVAGSVVAPALSTDPVTDGNGRGEVLEVGPGNLATVVRGGNDDRPEEIGPVLNEPFYKKVDVLGKDLFVWNDEASESELASAASITTLPFQYLHATTRDAAAKRRAERAAGIDWPEPVVTLDLSGGKGRPAKDKRLDWRNWPYDGLNPFGDNYRAP